MQPRGVVFSLLVGDMVCISALNASAITLNIGAALVQVTFVLNILALVRESFGTKFSSYIGHATDAV